MKWWQQPIMRWATCAAIIALGLAIAFRWTLVIGSGAVFVLDRWTGHVKECAPQDVPNYPAIHLPIDC